MLAQSVGRALVEAVSHRNGRSARPLATVCEIRAPGRTVTWVVLNDRGVFVGCAKRLDVALLIALAWQTCARSGIGREALSLVTR
jgi:hypothetical protein